MVIFRLLSFLIGHVGIKVRGQNIEKFMNMASSRGIYLWDIMRSGEDEVTVKARLSAVNPLRHIARKTGSRFKFSEREGLPFIISRLKRRKGLFLGALVFVCCMYVMSSFVWLVDVRGNQVLEEKTILQIASSAGVKKGVLKWKIEPVQVQAALMEELPQLSWAGVEVRGTLVVIEVVEKKIIAPEKYYAAHLVAKKAGLVKEVLVLEGNPQVAEGDTVVPGEILISGVIPPPENSLDLLPPTNVHSKGMVRARVWYEGYGEALLVEEGRRPTGNSASTLSIKIFSREIILSGPGEIPYTIYETQRTVKSAPQWRNKSLPVEVVSTQYLEMEYFQVRRDREEARALAEKKALEQVGALVPPQARIEEQRVQEVMVKDPENLVRVNVFVETLEDIAEEKPF